MGIWFRITFTYLIRNDAINRFEGSDKEYNIQLYFCLVQKLPPNVYQVLKLYLYLLQHNMEICFDGY